MYESLVVGYDGSPSSKAAVIEASNWTKRHGGKVTLAHAVFFDSEEFGIAPEQQEKRLAIGDKICIEAKDMITSKFGVEAHYVLCEGEPQSVLSSVAEGKAADLILLGTYGRRGLNRLLMGSITSQVISGATTDVMVVKKPCSECTGSYSSILVPFDGSECSIRALRRACQLAKLDSGEVTVLYVIPRYEELVGFMRTDSIKESLQQEAEKITAKAVGEAGALGVTVKTEIADGHAADEIVGAAKRLKTELIAMGSHGYRGLEKAIMGSTAERVIMDAACPILVVR